MLFTLTDLAIIIKLTVACASGTQLYLQVQFCLPWHVDYGTVIAHSSLHQLDPRLALLSLLENCTVAIAPSWPA